MSPSTALAYNCRSLESDPTPIEALRVECARCDPDNPLAIPRPTCPDCKGTGLAKVALAIVVGEIKQSRMAHLVGDQDDHESRH